ncbi:peptide ABC transporter substrate-binding protein [Candidatus Nitromaritima sp. SCGC AAA799-C22]|nr:peptide ABC transporter substrate-binding protein [Candidatus Nitromaritima sp. SCGC AAA799-C22]
MLNFSGEQSRILHLSWFAFFLIFAAWFNMAPFNTTLMRTAGLSKEQVDILMICNVLLTIPARILIGTLVDRYGPRKVFSLLLLFAGAVCFHFSTGAKFEDFLVSRLLMGMVGAGFVVGIKMIAEWFPPEKMGTAQGIYAGWGNFGAAAAIFSLPAAAAFFPEETGWRVAAVLCGGICTIWAGVYFLFAKEPPHQGEVFPVGLEHSIEVTSRPDLILQMLLLLPVYGAVAFFIWKLSGHPLSLLSPAAYQILLVGILLLYAGNVIQCARINLPQLAGSIPPEKQYEFRQIVILSLVYALTFGSELAVVSMFPAFLESTFGLSVAGAGALGSSFAVMNLLTRPAGGWISDLMGRKRSLIVLVAGSMLGYGLMSRINSGWPLWEVVAMAIGCSMFLQAGNGACFAVVPLIRRDLTGKMAGLAGAYGNVGAVAFLTVFSFVGARGFFSTIAVYAAFVLLSLVFLKPFNNFHHT